MASICFRDGGGSDQGTKTLNVYLLTFSILHKKYCLLCGGGGGGGKMMYSSVLFIIGWANATMIHVTGDGCCVFVSIVTC